jgi:hypothetical protein
LDYLFRSAPIERVWPAGFPAGSPGEAAYAKLNPGEERKLLYEAIGYVSI